MLFKVDTDPDPGIKVDPDPDMKLIEIIFEQKLFTRRGMTHSRNYFAGVII